MATVKYLKYWVTLDYGNSFVQIDHDTEQLEYPIPEATIRFVEFINSITSFKMENSDHVAIVTSFTGESSVKMSLTENPNFVDADFQFSPGSLSTVNRGRTNIYLLELRQPRHLLQRHLLQRHLLQRHLLLQPFLPLLDQLLQLSQPLLLNQ